MNKWAMLAFLIIAVGLGAVALSRGQSLGGNSVAILLTPTEYQAKFASADHLLLDVRTVEEFDEEHIAGAVNIPVDDLVKRLSEIPLDKPIIIYCRSGNRSAIAGQILTKAGYQQLYDMGGIKAWKDAGYAVE